MSSGLYQRWIRSWEERLCFRATNRVVRHFEWGLEWSRNWPCAQRYPKNGDAPADYVAKLNRIAIQESDHFFAYERPRDFRLDEGVLRFRSPVETPHPENNVVHAQWFPASNSKKAVVLLPHCNAPRASPTWCGPDSTRSTFDKAWKNISTSTNCATRGWRPAPSVTWTSSPRGNTSRCSSIRPTTPRFFRGFQERSWAG